MIKVLWWRFQQFSDPFTMLIVEWFSETGLFRHLPNYVFSVRNFGNAKSIGIIFSFQIFKISSRFQKWRKKRELFLCFWDNCIWIGIVELSLFRTEYLPSTANVLTSSPKIWYVNKRDFFHLNCLDSHQ